MPAIRAGRHGTGSGDPRSGELGSGARSGPGPRRPASRAAIVAGAVAALVAAGAGLGTLLTSGGPLALLDLDAPTPPAPVIGLPGWGPGGAPVPVTFVVGGPAVTTPLTVTGVAPASAGLPPDCPPQAWVVDVPQPVRIGPGTPPPRIPATVRLADDAPPGCQGLVLVLGTMTGTVDAVDASGAPVLLDGTADAPITVATLGTPGIAVTSQAGEAIVVTTPDPAAPPQTHYTVEATDAAGHWIAACRLRSATPCRTGRRATGSGVRYRVTARLGSRWHRDSAELRP